MNQIIISGRITKDIELKNVGQNNTAVVNTSVAVDRIRKNKDGERETDFFDVTFFGKTAESVAKYLGKGRKIIVTGEMQSRHFEKDGQKRTAWTLIANGFEFADSAKGNGNGNGNAEPVPSSSPAEDTPDFAVIEEDGELPF